MTQIKKTQAILVLLCLFAVDVLGRETIIDFSTEIEKGQDITETVKKTLANLPDKDVTLIFPEGTFYFTPEEATERVCAITNHDSGLKKIAFLFTKTKNIRIKGDNTTFLFTGEIFPFRFEDCQNIEISGISIDWTIPFFIQGEILKTNIKEQYYDIILEEDGFDFEFSDNMLKYPNQKGFAFKQLGHSLSFDRMNKSPIHGSKSFDIHRKSNPKIEQISKCEFRIHEKLRSYPPVGSIMTFKGKDGENRYSPAIHVIRCSDVRVTDFNVYHALGMGFLGEKTENIVLNNFNVCLQEGTNRMISATADATHFCNCKGKILLENCLFENMLDDGTNVHGTYLKVKEIISEKTLLAELVHFQQYGYVFAQKGDKVDFLITPSIDRVERNVISDFKQLSKSVSEVSFEKPLPSSLKVGDALENITWNTDLFIMRNCTLRNHRARNIVLKNPNTSIIEGNYLHSMMPAILCRAELFFWYESGANGKVIVRDNTFDNCMYGGGNMSVITLAPRLNKDYKQDQMVDDKVYITNNKFYIFDKQLIEAENVNNLKVKGNEILKNSRFPAFNNDRELIKYSNCNNVDINGNSIITERNEN